MLDLKGWRGDGIIAALNTPAEATCAKGLSLPIVNISATLPKTPVPRVSCDSRVVGELAADHLIERGFQQFAYYGLRSVAYSAVRQEGFDERLATSGFRSVSLLMPPTYRVRSQQWRDQQRKLVQWLHAAAEAGRAVCRDRLSRATSARRVPAGRPARAAAGGGDRRRQRGGDLRPRAAAALERGAQQSAGRLPCGGDAGPIDSAQAAAERGGESIPPLGVVARESTETVAFQDPRLCDAIDYLEREPGGPAGRAGIGVARGRLAAVDGVCVSRGVGREPVSVHPPPPT